jgi:3-deoxy-manno-octulosonate cytidylyltransferase (CMP-KDO synthetase)
MIAWVVEAALEAETLDEVWVATDSEAIAREAERAGARTAMTSPECASGTDRVAEVARSVGADVYVNLQGDEPLVESADIDALVRVFAAEPATRMATLARPADRPGELLDPNVVKVVCDAAGEALYFSRAPIPYYREAWSGEEGPGAPPRGQVPALRHLGLYAFRREALLGFTKLPVGGLEQAECLEQLRALEAGWRIRVLRASGDSVGVDRPEDLARAEQALRVRYDPGRTGC